MSRILIVEDEKAIAEGLAFNLRNAGFDALMAPNADAAGRLLAEPGRSFDLVILDVMLPGKKSGFDLAREIRRSGNFVPILLLTARALTADVIAGLDAGADDYLTKPFDLDHLLARIRVLLRRQAWTRAGLAGGPQGRIVEFGKGCRVDFETHRAVTVDGSEIQLSRLEALLLAALIQEDGKPVSRGRLLEDVWGAPGDLSTRTVDNFILRLRKYFEEDPSTPHHILTVRGVGYQFAGKSAESPTVTKK